MDEGLDEQHAQDLLPLVLLRQVDEQPAGHPAEHLRLGVGLGFGFWFGFGFGLGPGVGVGSGLGVGVGVGVGERGRRTSSAAA